MPYASVSFPVSVWDGLTEDLASVQIDTSPTAATFDRIRNELIATQTLVFASLEAVSFFSTLGTTNQLVGMNSAADDFEYKSVTGDEGVVITNSTGGIEIGLDSDGVEVRAQGSYSTMVSSGDGIVAGNPVTTSSATNGKVVPADDDDALFCGLALSTADTDEEVSVLQMGPITLSDWTAIAGAELLTPGEVYYVSSTAGQITTTAPVSEGKFIHVAGVAVTTTTLVVGVSEVAAIPGA